MPDRSSKKTTKKKTTRGGGSDPNQIAKRILEHATGEDEPKDDGKDPAAVELGRKGGKKGGKARAEKLTPEQRKAIAKKAAEARWSKETD